MMWLSGAFSMNTRKLWSADAHVDLPDDDSWQVIAIRPWPARSPGTDKEPAIKPSLVVPMVPSLSDLEKSMAVRRAKKQEVFSLPAKTALVSRIPQLCAAGGPPASCRGSNQGWAGWTLPISGSPGAASGSRLGIAVSVNVVVSVMVSAEASAAEAATAVLGEGVTVSDAVAICV